MSKTNKAKMREARMNDGGQVQKRVFIHPADGSMRCQEFLIYNYDTEEKGDILSTYKITALGWSRLVVPKSLRYFIYTLNHSAFNHRGRKRTIDAVEKQFWWSGMHRDIGNFVKKCDICQKGKQPRPWRAGLTQSLQ